VIVGAGLVGVSTAYWAARGGGAPPVILESSALAAGATGRSTGLVLTGGLEPFTELAGRVGSERAEALWELSRESTALLREEILAPGAVACDYQSEGSWRTAREGSAAEHGWRESVEILRGSGFDVTWRSASEVRHRAGGEQLGGALFAPGDGAVDPTALCQGLLEICGAELRTGIRVRHLEPRGDRVLLVWNGGRALARRAVLAVDGAVGPLVPSLATKVHSVVLQALATAPGPRLLEGAWLVAPDGLWLRQLADGTVLAAGGTEEGARGERGFLELPTASGQSRLEEIVAALFPRIGTLAPHHRWAGAIARSSDGLPWLRTVPDIGNAAYASGLDGHGLSLGFALGRRLAAWMDGDEEALRSFQAAATEPASGPQV
jgi:gamma-glutamylputrescine oxidase